MQTHLPLVFDRAIESIQQAAQDVSYIYDGSWFPWNHSEKSYESLSDEEQAAKLEAELQEQPGIMVFRRGLDGEKVSDTWTQVRDQPRQRRDQSRLSLSQQRRSSATTTNANLVVFVVAEQPTGGLSDAQFEHTLQWMQTIQPDHVKQPLLILGPTFSGTLPSLARELTPETLKPYEIGRADLQRHLQLRERRPVVPALSGQRARRVAAERSPMRNCSFRTFFEGDALMTNRFLCYLTA